MDKIRIEQLFELLGRKEAELWALRGHVTALERALEAEIARSRKDAGQGSERGNKLKEVM